MSIKLTLEGAFHQVGDFGNKVGHGILCRVDLRAKLQVLDRAGADLRNLRGEIADLLGAVSHAPLGYFEQGILDKGAVKLRLTQLSLCLLYTSDAADDCCRV